jgi:two-component system capsular synthesis sensor histidine kinase RcsC
VVDDHPANRVLIREQLKTLGYEVDLADEGGQALQRFDQNRYDVVMTDLNMPGMDGYSLARNLRAQGTDVPIIAITATASTSEHEQCVAAGMDAVLVKPMLLDTIDRMVRRFVSAASLRKHVADLAYGPLPANVHALMQQTLQQSLTSMRAALDKRDLAYVRDHLHALRGSFAMIREMDTAERARQMEALADAGDHEALKAAMQAFAEHATSVLERRTATPADT